MHVSSVSSSRKQIKKQRAGNKSRNRADHPPSSSREQSRGGPRTYLWLRASALGAGAPREGDARRGAYWAAGRPFEASMRVGRRAGRRPGRTEEWRSGRGWSGLAVGEECRAGGSCFLAERSVASQRNSVVRGFRIPARPYPSRARQISSGAKLSRARARPPPPNILPLARSRLPAASRRLRAA